MADLLIRGMEMPKAGQLLQVAENVDGAIFVRETTRGEWHKVVDIPEHGRLIDASTFGVVMYQGGKYNNEDFHAGMEYILDFIDNASTVVEASED